MSVRLYIAIAVALGAVACGGGSYSSPASPTTSTPPAGGSAVSIPVGAQTLGNRAYAPDEIDVAPGTTVTWVNADSQAHTSTSNVAGWDSGIVAPGGQFSFVFPTAGTFEYHCTLHPRMVGRVVVR